MGYCSGCFVQLVFKLYGKYISANVSHGLGSKGIIVEGWKTCGEISGLKFLIHKNKALYK